ncbi:hypothetical protein IHE45_17G050600 [Dioscorea alata]|uniref:Uncharacterized protein n=2 Tax=Dioscorea alata TaxID=55571 RepID=A0ACB7UCE6_DIOAL|nr:hypothetical protein IHE45_17G050600 [Dioscorea alata]KAH7657901.1 hypothetical protein IHE45_17G050600 [Dioscorea alata]
MEEDHQKIELMTSNSEKVDADLQVLGLKVNYHENNLAFLNAEMRTITKSVIDLEGDLAVYALSHINEEASNHECQIQAMKHTIKHIVEKEKTAAGIICQLQIRHGFQASKLPLTKDVVGVVATLGSVKDENVSRLLSEFLGSETMLGVVCKTFEGIKALEKYDKEGMIDKNFGLHGLGPSIGRLLEGKFLAISLENLRAYPGGFLAGDPQKRLDFPKPRLPDGKCPPGFLGFAVNMIDLDDDHLSCLTVNSHGLRETLFYNLFSYLQVYRSRAEMELAMPCISDGAISLDGGMIKTNGLFYLGARKEDILRFPTSFGKPTRPKEIHETREKLKLLQWKKERLAEDIIREKALLKKAKDSFHAKREEYEKFLNDAHQRISKVLPN